MLNLPSIHSFKDIMTCKTQFYFNVIIIVMQLHDMCMPTSRKVTAWKFQGGGEFGVQKIDFILKESSKLWHEFSGKGWLNLPRRG